MSYRSVFVRAAVLLLTFSLPLVAHAQSSTVTYQGQLRDNGAPVTDTVNLRFQLYDALTGGNSIGSEQQFVGWPVEDGLFQVELEFGAAAFDGSARFLEIEVDGAPLRPRQRVTAVPFALRAAETEAGAVGGTEVDTGEVQLRISGACPAGQYIRAVNENGTVLCGVDAPSWNLSGNAGTNAASDFIGTLDNQALEFRTQGVRSLRLEPSTELFDGMPITANVIVGSRANAVASGVRGATIIGGGLPSGDSDPDFTGEEPNSVTGHFGTVTGGYGNRAGDDNANPSVGAGASVGGGISNTANGTRSTVSGGAGNTASGSRSAIGGGSGNAASDFSSTVAGGDRNISSGAQATIAGGSQNIASGIGSQVSGGERSTASGRFSAVSGGALNCAGGAFSWAGGYQAKVRPGSDSGASGTGCENIASSGLVGDTGTFVWADSSGEKFISTDRNQFLVRAERGVGINNNAPQAELHVVGPEKDGDRDFAQVIIEDSGTESAGFSFIATDGTGVRRTLGHIVSARSFPLDLDHYGSEMSFFTRENGSDFPVVRFKITSGGSTQNTSGTWTTLSDRRVKSDIALLQDSLDLLLGLQGVRFRYREDLAPFDDTESRMGFVAQQVEQVLPEWVSENGEGYKQVTPTGFRALAVEAIRELRDEQQAAIVQLDHENTALRTRLAEVESRQHQELSDLRAELAMLRELVTPRLAETGR